MYWREFFEFVVILALAAVVLAVRSLFGEEQISWLVFAVVACAALKTVYYFWETLYNLHESIARDLAYHRFLLHVAYNMAQITFSYAVDFYCLHRLDPTSFSGIPPDIGGAELVFECFYFSVLNFSFFGYGDITPAHIPGKMVMLLEVVTAFSTVIFLLSDFVSIKDSMQRERVGK